jgi:hypothetical protein
MLEALMFTKQSRYYTLPDVIIRDESGQAQQSKSLRLLPEVTGNFQHTVEANDRLDHLAYKYYQRSQRWWHINDANPDFLSPLALLGKEPVQTVRFQLYWDDEDGPPPWAAVRRDLLAQPGVEELQVQDALQLTFRTLTVDEEVVSMATSTPDRALVIRCNMLLGNVGDLIALLAVHGFQQVQAEVGTRVGKPITIPPMNATSQ